MVLSNYIQKFMYTFAFCTCFAKYLAVVFTWKVKLDVEAFRAIQSSYGTDKMSRFIANLYLTSTRPSDLVEFLSSVT